MKCFNCNSPTHGFKSCPQIARFCKKCKTFGHPERRCEELHGLCWFCAEIGQVQKAIHNSCCEMHVQIKSCGAMIVDEDNMILCIKSPHAKIWSLPKGHQTSLDEEYHVCAMREVFEETSIQLDIKKDDKIFSFQKRRYFIIKISNSAKQQMKVNLDTKEASQYSWIRVADLNKFHTNADLQYIRTNFQELV